ncbi:MAG: PH domain-containing protein [Clostridia bacterium]|nr:PH domain-containing protein [Clostridia bacterium]
MSEKNYRTPSLKAVKLMRITSSLSLAIFLVMPSVIASLYYRYELSYFSFVIIGAVLLFSFLYIAITPKIRFNRYKYLIEADRIEIIEGLFFIRRTIVPIDRIYQIDIQKGPIDNMVGVAKVRLTTAGSSAAFRFLEPETADEIAMHLNTSVLAKIKAEGTDENV